MNEWLGGAGVATALGVGSQIVYALWKDLKGGGLRQSQAEAAKTSLDVAQAEQSLPHVQEALRLGNIAEAVSIQQQVINGLKDHALWADGQIKARDARIAELEARLADRDTKIEELEARLDVAEAAQRDARRIIDELRATSRAEKPTIPPQANPHR